MTTDQRADDLLAIHAALADGLWHAPAGATAPDRYRLIADALGAAALTSDRGVRNLST